MRDSKTSLPKHCGQRILAISHLRTGNREPGTGNREQGTGNREPGTGNREPGTGNQIYRDWAIDLKENLIQQGLV